VSIVIQKRRRPPSLSTFVAAALLIGCEGTLWLQEARPMTDAASTADAEIYEIPPEEIFSDDFTGDLARWELFGVPEPEIRRDEHGRPGVFDNHGDVTCDSGAITNAPFDLRSGFVLEAEIFVEVTNRRGCWNHVLFGVAADRLNANCNGTQEPRGALGLGLTYVGDACWLERMQAPQSVGHAWIHLSFADAFGTTDLSTPTRFNPALLGDALLSGWHRYVIRADHRRFVEFEVDGRRVARSRTALAEAEWMDWSRARVMIQGRSSGSAGFAYVTALSLRVPGPLTLAR